MITTKERTADEVLSPKARLAKTEALLDKALTVVDLVASASRVVQRRCAGEAAFVRVHSARTGTEITVKQVWEAAALKAEIEAHKKEKFNVA